MDDMPTSTKKATRHIGLSVHDDVRDSFRELSELTGLKITRLVRDAVISLVTHDPVLRKHKAVIRNLK